MKSESEPTLWDAWPPYHIGNEGMTLMDTRTRIHIHTYTQYLYTKVVFLSFFFFFATYIA